MCRGHGAGPMPSLNPDSSLSCNGSSPKGLSPHSASHMAGNGDGLCVVHSRPLLPKCQQSLQQTSLHEKPRVCTDTWAGQGVSGDRDTGRQCWAGTDSQLLSQPPCVLLGPLAAISRLGRFSRSNRGVAGNAWVPQLCASYFYCHVRGQLTIGPSCLHDTGQGQAKGGGGDGSLGSSQGRLGPRLRGWISASITHWPLRN